MGRHRGIRNSSGNPSSVYDDCFPQFLFRIGQITLKKRSEVNFGMYLRAFHQWESDRLCLIWEDGLVLKGALEVGFFWRKRRALRNMCSIACY
ncbi:hypothetical protein TNCV_908591 [Trichonephila clavipes]|nr:hypothetical protein TNCV_908591 [Trichonephila clavipes]